MGWIGFIILILCAGIAGFTGSKLGKCWDFIVKQRPDLKESGDPYPTIATHAIGKWGDILVNGSAYMSMLGNFKILLDQIFDFQYFLR